MANPEDPVTHGELSALLDEKLEQLRDLLPKIPTPAPTDDDDDDDDDLGPKFSLRDMEAYAERQVKKAVRDLGVKSPKKPTVKPVKDDDDDEPVIEPKVEPVKVVEPTPDPSPGKKTKQEKFWGVTK